MDGRTELRPTIHVHGEYDFYNALRRCPANLVEFPPNRIHKPSCRELGFLRCCWATSSNDLPVVSTYQPIASAMYVKPLPWCLRSYLSVNQCSSPMHQTLFFQIFQSTYYETFSDVTNLALYGLALGWAVGLTERPRFLWIFNLRRWYAGIIFLATPAAYSAISNVDVLKHDLVDFSSWGAPFIALWSVAMVSIAGVVAWHVRSAWRRCSPAGFAVYVAFRALVFTWFGVSAIALEHSNPPVRVHLHHLYIGWALALWADVNSPLSAVTLAIGAGIFVQGVAAYSFAPIFTADGCFETPSSAAIKCKFWNESPFTLNICPAAGSVPRHQCD